MWLYVPLIPKLRWIGEDCEFKAHMDNVENSGQAKTCLKTKK